MPNRVLIVLAGEDAPLALIREWADRHDTIVAADSGADRCLEAGVVPTVVVGDFDSLRRAKELPEAILHRSDDQDTTDFEKALHWVSTNAPDAKVTVIGFEGDRIDHVLYSLHVAALHPLRPILAQRNGILVSIHGGETHEFAVAAGTVLSLVAVLPSIGVHLSGVKWPLHDAELTPGGLESISNLASESSVKVAMMTGAAWLFFEQSTGVVETLYSID